MKKITWKHESEIRGIPIGPVVIVDQDAMRADLKAQGFGVPYGYKPDWLDERGYMGREDAEKLARSEGLVLEEA